MPPNVEQVPRERPDRVRSEAVALVFLGEEEVDPGMAVPGLVLLGVLDAAGDGAIDLDREAHALPVVFEPLIDRRVGVRGVPPARDARFGEDLAKPLAVVWSETAEANLLTDQLDAVRAPCCHAQSVPAGPYFASLDACGPGAPGCGARTLNRRLRTA